MFKAQSTSIRANSRVNTNTPRRLVKYHKVLTMCLYAPHLLRVAISNGLTILGPADTTVFAQESYVGQGLR